MHSSIPSAISRAPVGWHPQTAIDAQFPAVARLRRAIKPEIRKFEARLDQEETAGKDTASRRLTLRELRWRLEYTGDAAAIAATYDRLRAAISLPSLRDTAARGGEDGNGGFGTDVWFLQLDALADHMLAADFDNRGEPPSFLDRMNDPCRLKDYLEGLLVSRPVEDGIDRRKELNFATAALVRLILRRRPANYFWDPRLEMVIATISRGVAGPGQRFFRRRLPDRQLSAQDSRPQPDFPHGAISRRQDRVLAAAYRHALRHARPSLSPRLARRNGDDLPQQL